MGREIAISYALTEADVLLGRSEVQRKYHRAISDGYSRSLPWLVALAAAFSTAASLDMLERHPGTVSRDFAFVILPMLGALIGAIAYYRSMQRNAFRLYLDGIGPFPLAQTLTLSDDGLTVTGPNGTVTMPWRRVEFCVARKAHIVIMLRPWAAVMIPLSAFADMTAANEFVRAVCARLTQE